MTARDDRTTATDAAFAPGSSLADGSGKDGRSRRSAELRKGMTALAAPAVWPGRGGPEGAARAAPQVRAAHASWPAASGARVPRGGPARGFTLIELTVVLVVVALLIGAMLIPLSTQLEVQRVRTTQEQLREIKEALMGYALVNDRLPCPAIPSSRGDEVSRLVANALDYEAARNCCAVTEGDDGLWCSGDEISGEVYSHGFVPATALGLQGPRNADGLLVDAWGNPIRYSVSAADEFGLPRPDLTVTPTPPGPNFWWDFLTPGEMRAVGMGTGGLRPSLHICSTAADKQVVAANVTRCRDADATLIGAYGPDGGPGAVIPGVPVVFYSLGANGRETEGLSADEYENAGDSPVEPRITMGGGPSGIVYLVADDTTFVSRPRTGDFDDLVEWLSAQVLYVRMMQAGLLP